MLNICGLLLEFLQIHLPSIPGVYVVIIERVESCRYHFAPRNQQTGDVFQMNMGGFKQDPVDIENAPWKKARME